jgi:hypothetical protein
MKQRFVLMILFVFAAFTFGYGQFPTLCVQDAIISVKGVGADGEIINCNGDGIPDVYTFKTSVLPTPFGFLVTDEDNVILGISINNTIDLEPFGPGALRVWAFSFIGQVTAQVGDDADTTPLASICYALTANFIPVSNVIPEGGTVSTADGSTSQYVCPDDPNGGVVAFSTTSSSPVYTYVITDENNLILDFAPDGSYDFSASPNGICRVWGLSYVGNILAAIGDDAATTQLAEDCFALSDNFVEIIKADPDAGMVSLMDGTTEATVCIGDGVDDVLQFMNNSPSLAPYAYVITDDNNIILDVVLGGNSANFNDAPPGVCRVWGLSYSGNVTAEVGDNAAAIDLSDGCFDLSDNFITVNRKDVDGGTVAIAGGSTEENICVNDGVADEFTFTNTSTSVEAYAYVVTDENNVILKILTGDSNDFDDSGIGICRVWGLSFSGNVLAEVGDDAAAVALTDECFELSSNFVTINRLEVDGGTVALADGSTETTVCVGDGVSDELTFTNTTTSTADYAFVVTDEDNNILDLSTTGVIDFDGAPVGICRVWGLSYTGSITAEIGDNAATTTLTDECFELSGNFVVIDRKDVDGGTVAIAGGSTEENICVNDGVADEFTFTNTSTSSEAYAYVVTDENNVILKILTGDSNDFDDAGIGICRVWGLSFSGNVLAEVGDDAAAVALTDECFELSSNFVTINRLEVDGGTVALADGGTETTVCVGDGVSDELTFTNTTTSAADYAFVVTDEDNNILDLSTTGVIDFDGAPVGICRVWGLSYTGSITAEIGDNAATTTLTDECFELSTNFVVVDRKDVDGGMVAIAGGSTEENICVNDGVADEFTFTNTSTSSEAYAYVVTDENNVILKILTGDSNDFDDAGIGICRVWGLSFSGNVLAEVGDDAAAVALTDECFELSSNFVTINRLEVDGGTVALADGGTETTVCVGDGVSDELTFTNTTTSAADYAFVVTDEDNNILDLSTTGVIDFDGAPVGICRVWGLSYTGSITAEIGDNAATTALTDECFELSANFVVVDRKDVDGGMVALADGSTEATACIGDGVADTFTFTNTSTSGEAYAYVVTDENNVILEILAGDSNDFDGADAGICRVWGLSFSGNVLAEVGDDAAAVALTDECFELSSNFVTITRKAVDGGLVRLTDGTESALVCLGDGSDATLTFLNTSTATESYVYVITDDDNNILAFTAEPTFDFSTVSVGVCRIWGLSYSGNVLAEVGDNAAAVALTDECFDLSDNFIEVSRQEVDGGIVSFGDGTLDEKVACVGDGVADEFFFVGNPGVVSTYAFLVTDTDNNIIDVLSDGENSLDFETAPLGVFRIWGVSYSGNLIAALGDNAAVADLSDACFDLSDNFLEVRSEMVDGGTVAMSDGETFRFVCPGDFMEDIIEFDSTGMTSASYVYVITDDNNIILEVITDDSFDFNNAPEGICRVWGLAFSGNLIAAIGDDAGAVALSDECFDLSDNFITIVREVPDGGDISTSSGEDVIFTCPGDGNPDIITFDSTGTSNTPYIYIITDLDGAILAFVDDGDSFDFENVSANKCLVWGLAYTGNIIAELGDIVSAVPLSDDCFDLAGNLISVNREVPVGGEVFTNAGQSTVFICPGDDMSDVVTFQSFGASGGPYVYIVTDEDNTIISILDGIEEDFNTSPTGVCRVWGLAYTGEILAEVGNNAAGNTPLTTDCWSLSDNFVTVIKETPMAGSITANGGNAVLDLCVGDNIPDVINFEVDGASNSQYLYLVTDENGFLIGTLEQDSFDFEFAIGGTFVIYGLAYTGNFSGFPGDNIFDFPLSTDCFDITDNFITLNLSQVDGAFVATSLAEETVFICPGDGVADFVSFINTSAAAMANYSYIVTTETNLIVAVLPGSTQNFENTGFDVLRVWGLSYTGNLTASIGQDAATTALSDECFSLSGNFVTVVRDVPDAGEVSVDGETTVDYCFVNGNTTLDVENSSTSLSGYVYLLTDENNNILDFFENEPVDFGVFDTGETLRIWGLSYTGQLTIEIGVNAAGANLATSCFDLSSNFITVNLGEMVDGGILSTQTGETIFYTCPGDDVADIVALFTTSLDTNYLYVITDSLDNVIQPDVEGNVIDFDAAAPGVCRIYGISFTGDFTVNFGDNVFADPLSTDCWAVSENYITLIRQTPEGGTITTGDGSVEVEIVAGDGAPDIIDFVVDGNGIAQYVYVITTETNKILDVTADNFYDFENAEEPVCRVWGLSYTGDLLAQPGDDAASTQLTSDCWDLSDNFITVLKDLDNLDTDNDATTLAGSSILSIGLTPNPATDWLQVQFELDAVSASESLIQIIDFNGSVVFTQQVSTVEGNNNFELPISNLTSGSYVVRLINANSVKSQLFIKQQF